MQSVPALAASCALVLIILSGPAAGRDEDARARLPESVNRVEAETGGRVLQVRPMQRGDQQIYRMKVLTPEGRVRVMQDNPRHRPREAVAPVPPQRGERPPVAAERERLAAAERERVRRTRDRD